MNITYKDSSTYNHSKEELEILEVIVIRDYNFRPGTKLAREKYYVDMSYHVLESFSQYCSIHRYDIDSMLPFLRSCVDKWIRLGLMKLKDSTFPLDLNYPFNILANRKAFNNLELTNKGKELYKLLKNVNIDNLIDINFID